MVISIPSVYIAVGIVLLLFVVVPLYVTWDDARKVKRGELSDR